MNPVQKHPHKNKQSDVWSSIWTLCDSAKLTENKRPHLLKENLSGIFWKTNKQTQKFEKLNSFQVIPIVTDLRLADLLFSYFVPSNHRYLDPTSQKLVRP